MVLYSALTALLIIEMITEDGCAHGVKTFGVENTLYRGNFVLLDVICKATTLSNNIIYHPLFIQVRIVIVYS